jgi:hypothetical protein
MFTHDEFAEAVIRHFQFLESDFGLRREPQQKADGRSWVSYANAALRVIVEYEIDAYCTVTVQNIGHVKRDPLERSEFDLDEIVAVSAGRPQKKQDPRAMADVIARSAETLRTNGATVLGGNFDALHERQRKTVESLRRSFPPTPHENPPPRSRG